MKKIRLITKDAALRKEVSAALPRGFTIAAKARGNCRIVLIDTDTCGAAQIKEHADESFVVAIIRGETADRAMTAVASGAYETISRPIKKELLSSLLEELQSVGSELSNVIPLAGVPPAPTCAIVGESSVVIDLCKKIARLAQVEVPVLITGETGTGKELIAESIAQTSSRFGRPFVVVNCAAFPEALLESELFGYEKGAFTGAAAAKEGILKVADEGCVFFDEVGELPLALQGKLLRFLQTQTFYPIGSIREVQVNVRVISATNRDLPKMVREGKFREDLYHRIRVATIHAPSLSERKGDIPSLVNFFIHRHRQATLLPIKGITGAFMNKLISYDWPGNIRELENTVRSAIAISKTRYLTTHELRELGSLSVTRQEAPVAERLSASAVPLLREFLERKDGDIYEKIHRELDKTIFDFILSYANENQSEAARLLGISRLTLRKKLGLLRQ